MFRKVKSAPPVPYHLQPYTYKYVLDPVVPLPAPWKDHQFAKSVYLLPLDFCMTFVDNSYLLKVERDDTLRIAELAESMLVEGIKTPIILVIDGQGKLRYHDGYHRLSVILANREHFPYIPCLLNHSTGTVRAYGRTVQSEIDTILKFVAQPAD
jgi:hypothetical protein